MSDAATTCEGCGALLPHADAVCARCEAELTTEPPSPPAKYICPHCHQRFAEPVPVLWPPCVPWWRPTTFRLQCPHCDAALRDRYRSTDTLLYLTLTATYVVLSETAYAHRRLWAYPIVIGVPLWFLLRHRRAVRNPDRYVVGTRPQWLRDIRDLWRDTRH